jgi:mono/diheme cytochrome c family protein|tara:strand:- start:166 stop:834 length:669 start_codon:yes stop_codon:yes gene_type:complete
MSDQKNNDSNHLGMNDEEMVELHAKLNKEKHPPTQGFLIAPLIFVFVFGCLIFVCSIQLAHSTNGFQVHPPQEVVELSDEEKEVLRLERKIDSGKKLYAVNCASCHQPSGLGLGEQYPPLAGSEWVSANPELIIKVILKGLVGEIKVKGKTYNPVGGMAAVTNLKSDREIANVTTYVRQAWGNEAPEVSVEEVAQARAESAEQKDQWVGDALQSLYLNNSSE